MIEEQVGNIQKHTDDANIIKDSVSLVEETTPIDEQKQKIDLAKTSVETEKLTGGKKADKPSVRIKVFLICMRCTVIQTIQRKTYYNISIQSISFTYFPEI